DVSSFPNGNYRGVKHAANGDLKQFAGAGVSGGLGTAAPTGDFISMWRLRVESQKRLALIPATVSCLVVLCPRALPQGKGGIVNKARAMYYNLAAHGVKEFRCDVAPDWKKFLASTRNHAVPDNDPELKRLGLLRFELQATVTEEPRVIPSTLGPLTLDDNLMQ